LSKPVETCREKQSSARVAKCSNHGVLLEHDSSEGGCLADLCESVVGSSQR
jgi:hypothetical protein